MIRYVTRWALSSGIREVSGEYTDDGRYFRNAGGRVFVPAKEAFEDLQKAKDDAKTRAKKRAKALGEQAAKLSSPRWEPKIVRLADVL